MNRGILLPKLHEVDPANKKISFNDAPAWNAIILKAYDGWFKDNCKLFPYTYELLKSMPSVSTAMFSILAPSAEIPPHTGKFSGIYRYHFALRAPTSPENCYMNISDEKFHWNEGQGILFDDTYEHSVSNNTMEQRIVLFLDVKRNSSSFVKKINNWILKIVQRSPVFKNAIKSGIIYLD